MSKPARRMIHWTTIFFIGCFLALLGFQYYLVCDKFGFSCSQPFVVTDWEKLSAVLRNFSLIGGGVFGLWLAANRTKTAQRQADIAESGQVTDRFQKGIELLNENEPAKIEAGIVSLESVASQNPDQYYIAVQKLLCSFIRDRSRKFNEMNSIPSIASERQSLNEGNKPFLYPGAPEEIVSAVKAFCRIRKAGKHLEIAEKYRPDLTGSYLAHITLVDGEADFSSCQLNRCILAVCLFVDADFNDSVMHFTDVSNCRFIQTDLSNVVLQCSNAYGTRFEGIKAINLAIRQTHFTHGFFETIDKQKTSFVRNLIDHTCFNTVMDQINFSACSFSVGKPPITQGDDSWINRGIDKLGKYETFPLPGVIKHMLEKEAESARKQEAERDDLMPTAIGIKKE